MKLNSFIFIILLFLFSGFLTIIKCSSVNKNIESDPLPHYVQHIKNKRHFTHFNLDKHYHKHLFQIKSKLSGKCIHIKLLTKTNGASISQLNCLIFKNFKWKV